MKRLLLGEVMYLIHTIKTGSFVHKTVVIDGL